MRPFQLSALLVSAAMLLSGCYLGRSSVDRSDFDHTYSRAEVCEVSAIPMVAETVVSTFFLTVAVVGFASSNRGPQSIEDAIGNAFLRGIVAPGAALIALPFAADAVAGAFAVSDCSDAKEEWEIMKKMEAQRKREWRAPQPPEKAEEQPTPAPDPTAETPR
jgi:hypothetical protein